jgi:pantothenate kinase
MSGFSFVGMADHPDWCTTEEVVDRARALVHSNKRTILGITGPPGAGKSTLANAVVEQVGDVVAHVGMDGFHLAHEQLLRLGRASRKGAVDTFDASGFVSLVRRLRCQRDDVVYAPKFDRHLEEPIAGAVAIDQSVRLVVVEGNYLLLDEEPWAALRELMDEVWYCQRDDTARIAGLVARHERHGKSPSEARAWATGSDESNAAVVAATIGRAQRVLLLREDRDLLPSGGDGLSAEGSSA